MTIASLRGMRYPDTYVVRMFHKLGLDQTPGRVLELGCSSANNLMHFCAFGWEAVGLDCDAAALADGRHNLGQTGGRGHLIDHDLNTGLPDDLAGPFHALLIPSTLYYITRPAVWDCLRAVRPRLAARAAVYLRSRLPDDHRCGRGTAAEPGGWRLTIDYTGELGCLNVFWDEWELLDLLRDTLDLAPAAVTRLRVAYDNIQGGRLIRNSDIVLWGRLP